MHLSELLFTVIRDTCCDGILKAVHCNVSAVQVDKPRITTHFVSPVNIEIKGQE